MLIMYGIISKELISLEIRIDKAADRDDSMMMSFRGHYATETPINYESPIVRCIILPRLVIRENEWYV